MMDSPGRITDPQTVSRAGIERELSRRGKLTIQFSRSEAYSSDLLEGLNEICAELPETLQIRFFGHYDTGFDASVLRHLPAVRNLSLDSLFHIRNDDTISGLPQLRRLGFGVYEYSRPDFLSLLNLTALAELSLHDTRKRDFDLAPLAKATSLTGLHLQGQCRGIEALAGLSGLTFLHLGSIAARQGLGVIAALPNLQGLSLMLGGRSNLDELASPTLQDLQIIRVRGLTSLGDLSRLPALLSLSVEDQAQLARLDLSGPRLRHLQLVNCKTLQYLAGLDGQDRLQSAFISQTALDMDILRDRNWPGSMQAITLAGSRMAWNAATKAHFAMQGISSRAYR